MWFLRDGSTQTEAIVWLNELEEYGQNWRVPTTTKHSSGKIVYIITRAPSQYPKRRLFVRSRKVSKPRDLYLELSDRSEIWQALRQQCCRCACQISKRYDNLKYQSRGFETLRDLTKRRLFGYWDGALDAMSAVYRVLHLANTQITQIWCTFVFVCACLWFQVRFLLFHVVTGH